MSRIQKQIRRLLAVSALSSFQLAGASWVALLAARGFSLVEIGLAESCFHVASLIFEIPSGVISDVFGRKKSMVMSQVMFVLSALCMALSRGMAGVCLALVLDAWGYNFASGAREALAYDSLKSAGQEEKYMDFSARELSIYRIGNAAAILCAGLALLIGYRAAYLLDALFALAGLALAWGLQESENGECAPQGSVPARILGCFRDSLRFLVHSASSLRLMLASSLVGAAATLTAFFLQARLTRAGVSGAALGPALFAISMGGAVGARLAVRISHWSYRRMFALSAAGAAFGVACGAGMNALWMCAGGFIASLSGDLLEVRTDAALNERFPSSQRSTLLSVASLVFSLVMIVLSPLAGMLFE